MIRRVCAVGVLGFVTGFALAQQPSVTNQPPQGRLDDVAIWVVDPLVHVLDPATPGGRTPKAIEIQSARGEFENGAS